MGCRVAVVENKPTSWRIEHSLQAVLLCVLCVLAVNAAFGAADLPLITVDRDNFQIRESARVVIAHDVIADHDGDGVVHIIGDDLVVDFTGAHLRGAAEGLDPDQYSGIGVRITGSGNTLRGGRFSGYKVAIFAENADGLTIEDVDVSDNFRQRLRSTPEAPSDEDLLDPHKNDNREWMTSYGGGISVESSDNIIIRRVLARNVQNGILLSRVNNSRIYDNDCSFLSGWGLAMWRSSDNTITRNAFDFCVRGYSHGVYNTGHNSAGILMAEQCSHNVIARNSVTHSGAGLLGFPGREALGEVDPREEVTWYIRRGNTDNLLLDNDFSYAATYGVKMTFGFGNQIVRSRIVGNAVTGVSAGFSQSTLIGVNEIRENGDMPRGSDHGGVSIEHGYNNRIQENWFNRNSTSVRLTSREDHPALALPWSQVNQQGSARNVIFFNRFHQEKLIGEFLNTRETAYGRNAHVAVVDFFEGDEESLASFGRPRTAAAVDREVWERLDIRGETTPVGARAALRGREHIVMTKWGPYDWSTPRLHLAERRGSHHVYYVLGVDEVYDISIEGDAELERPDDDPHHKLTVRSNRRGRLVPYSVRATTSSGDHRADGVLVPAAWGVTVFEWNTDPREDADSWREEAIETPRRADFSVERLILSFGEAGASQLPDVPDEVKHKSMSTERFGTLANSRLTFPAGAWRIRTVSADGIRVWLNDEKVIDDWAVRPAADHSHEFTLSEEREIAIRVEHFALTGYATLELHIERE